MPRDHRTSKEEFPLTEAQRLRQQGKSYHDIANAIGWSFAQVRRKLQAVPINGDTTAHPNALERIDETLDQHDARLQDVSTVALAIPTPAHPSASQRISALPVHYDASAVNDLQARVSTLEAFMAVVQAQQRLSALPAHQSASAHPSASQRTEPPVWVNRGTHLAADMVDAVKAYAVEHRLEIREVIDLALRTFFASQGVGDA